MLHRRAFVFALLAGASAAGAARAQGLNLEPIEAQNPLETAFLAAFADPAARPAFRQRLLESPVALSLSSNLEDAPPRLLDVGESRRTGFIFTSPARLSAVFGAEAPHVVLPGREALTRLRAHHVVINWRLAPMLTLEPSDVAEYLAL